MTARAQEPWIAEPGQRVRISYGCRVAAGSLPAGCQRAVGALVTLGGDTLTLSGGGSTTSYPLSTVARLELSRGRESHWLAGAGVGLLVGTVTALAAAVGGSNNPCENNQDANRLVCLGFAAAGGAVGGVIGGLVGLASKTERWEEAPRDRLRVSIGPYRGGVELKASLRF